MAHCFWNVDASRSDLVDCIHPYVHILAGRCDPIRVITENTSCPDKKVYVSDIQSNLYITKPAVSQMLNTLEKKGYVIREIDKSDRRKIAVALTSEGQGVLRRTEEYSNKMPKKPFLVLGKKIRSNS